MDINVNTVRSASMPALNLIEIGAWLFQRRGWLPWLLAAPLIAPYGVQCDPVANLCAAVPFLVFGETVRLISVGFAGRAVRAEADRLRPIVTTGPYRVVRNPLYIGNLVLLVGVLLLLGRWRLAPALSVLAAVYYHITVLWEEYMLRHLFGDEYAAYSERVRRWLPGRNCGVPASIHRLDLRAAVDYERGTLAALLLVIATFAGLAAWYRLG